MRNKITGGQLAFPKDYLGSGMNIRTYLAAHAPLETLVGNFEPSYDLSDKAALAVRWADALIEELNK